MAGEAQRICPSCAGQLTEGAQSCQWCGLSLVEGGETRVGPAMPPVTRPDVGFGEGGARPLPPLPPPPKALPFEKLNGGQIILRVIIVLAIAYIIAVFGGRGLRNAVCSNAPGTLICPNP